MTTVTLGIASRDAFSKRFVAAMQGQEQGHHITFETPELLFQTLTQMRWNILKVMTGAGPLSIREVARRVGRDVKRVHEDIQVLLETGVIDREAGMIVFPYDAIHVDFMLETQAA